MKEVDAGIKKVQDTGHAQIAAHGEYIDAEFAFRREKRLAEHRIREAQPKLTNAAVELLVETDAGYVASAKRWREAQVNRTRCTAEAEVARLQAWAAVRLLDGMGKKK